MIKREISVDEIAAYEQKFSDFHKMNDQERKVAMSQDVTLFAYVMFKDRDGKPLKLYPFQDLVVNDKSKTIALCVARQSGKSTLAIIKALHLIFYNDETTVLVISKTKDQSMELIQKLRSIIATSELKDSFKELATGADNRREFYIKNLGRETHSRIISVPATDAARGYSADMVIADEIAYWEDVEVVFNEAIIPTIRHTKGDIMMISTPRSKIGVFYEAFVNHDIWSCYQFDWRACPINTPEEMEITRRQVGDFAFRREYEASFAANQAAYFKEAEIRGATDNRAILGEYTARPVVMGIDFGKKMDNSVVMIGCIDNPEDRVDEHIVRVIDIIEKPLGTNYDTVVKEIVGLCSKYNVTKIMYDQTGVGEGPGDFMKDAGILPKSHIEGIMFSIKSKMDIYGNLKMLFERGQIKIPNNKRLLDELLLFEYEYTSGDRMKLHHPEKGHDDYADALALMTYGLKRVGVVPVSITIAKKGKGDKVQEPNEKFKKIWDVMFPGG